MKKRYVLGSAIVALLMLVSTQVVFLNIARSDDPQAHEGDADAGDIWISELDVSPALSGFDFIGISHAEATDDWVIWTDGSGNINASWSVDIEARNHPEYYVLFSLVVYNVDDNCNEIGNDTFSKSYIAGLSYDESGILSVAVDFTQQQQQAGSQTLVCYLGACAKINNTMEAADFHSVSLGRCVVGVDFTTPETQPPFALFRAEANNNFPSMVSWIDGWDENSRFANEDDMLNTQTYFNVGKTASQTQQQGWHLGNITAYRTLYHADVEFEYDDLTIYENTTNDWVSIFSYMDYNITSKPGWNPGVHMRYRLWYENHYEPATALAAYKYWKDSDPSEGFFGRKVIAQDRNSDDNITIDGHLFVFGFAFIDHFKLENYTIQITGTDNSSGGSSGGSYYWEDSCAYQNDSIEVEVSSSESAGITTVEANLYDVLRSQETGESIFSFAGDRDDVRIEFTCES